MRALVKEEAGGDGAGDGEGVEAGKSAMSEWGDMCSGGLHGDSFTRDMVNQRWMGKVVRQLKSRDRAI